MLRSDWQSGRDTRCVWRVLLLRVAVFFQNLNYYNPQRRTSFRSSYCGRWGSYDCLTLFFSWSLMCCSSLLSSLSGRSSLCRAMSSRQVSRIPKTRAWAYRFRGSPTSWWKNRTASMTSSSRKLATSFGRPGTRVSTTPQPTSREPMILRSSTELIPIFFKPGNAFA